MLTDFKDARVVITGGASGIGLALAKRLYANGAKLALCDYNKSVLQTAIIEMPTALGLLCDVADSEVLMETLETAVDHLGGIDMGWNNAGIMQNPTPFHDLSSEDYAKVMDVNLNAVVTGSQWMIKRMIAQGTPATLMNTGSENSLFHAVRSGGAYVASKMAVRAITESLAQDVPEHIAVKLLCPGFVNTSLGPSAMFQHGMDADRFAEIIYPLLTSDQFYLVSHGYNAVRLQEATDAILADIQAGAASAEETKRFDVGVLMGQRS